MIVREQKWFWLKEDILSNRQCAKQNFDLGLCAYRNLFFAVAKVITLVLRSELKICLALCFAAFDIIRNSLSNLSGFYLYIGITLSLSIYYHKK